MLSSLPSKVKIVEVGPRDGLQNESQVIESIDKVKYIEMLASSGLKTVEATSFVRADRIPQMADSEKVFNLLKKKESLKTVNLPCLVPNLKGLDKAIEAGVKEISVFTATSDTFNQKNINATTKESLERLEIVMKKATESKIKIRGYISTVFGCPYIGKTSLDNLIEISKTLLDLGAYEISLGDTIGIGHPLQVKNILECLKKDFSLDKFALHFHDTRGLALANILIGLELGITTFDSSSGGLGGCPYAKGATGNVATEDVVYMLESMGVNTGIDMDKLSKASLFILKKLNKETESKYLKAYINTGK